MRLNFFLLIAIVGILFSCNQEITVGSTILEDTTIDVEYTDTLNLEVKTVTDDTVIVYRSTINSQTYLLGELDDSSFGFSKSDVYLSINIVNGLPLFDTLTIDSVVMIFPLDSFGQQGFDEAIHDISVFQLEEELELNEDNNILGSQDFDFGTRVVGQYSSVINHSDSVRINTAIKRDSSVLEGPQLRIRMDVDWWEPILRDTMLTNIDSSEIFREMVKGFVLRSVPSQNSMAGLNLADNNSKRIEVYYTNVDNTNKVYGSYRFDLGSTRSNNFIHDYSSSSLGSMIDQPATDFAYLQTMQGVNMEVDLKSVLDLENTIINRATLELFLLEEIDPIVDPIESLDVLFISDLGDEVQILDSSLSSSGEFLDGQLKSEVIDGQTLRKYELNITNQVILVARGAIENSKITIQARNKPQRATRSIILGPDDPNFPIKLKLVTSKP